MKGGPKSSLRPFLHRALQFMLLLNFLKTLAGLFYFIFISHGTALVGWVHAFERLTWYGLINDQYSVQSCLLC